MKTGTLTVEVDYDDDGDVEGVRLSGDGSPNGEIAAAAALLIHAKQTVGISNELLLTLLVDKLDEAEA